MKLDRATSRRRGIAALAIGCTLGLAVAAAGTPDAETREIMGRIVGALQVLLPLSLTDDGFTDPARQPEIAAALDVLAVNGQQLAVHGSDRDASFAFLSETLARDAAEVRDRFAGGRVSGARFLLRHLTETCVACHSRLPDEQPRPLGRRLTRDEALSGLEALDRVELEIATRQFEQALSTYETAFVDPALSPSDFDLGGHFSSYLEVCLRVNRDAARAIGTLENVRARGDLSPRLLRIVESWLASLRELAPAPGADTIARARSFVGDPAALRPVSAADAVVPLIVASGILHRYVAEGGHTPEELGEAYYLLGAIESRIGHSFWASQTEGLLEAAIRSAPGAPFADDAYALLEEFLISGYTGSRGTDLPPDVVARLEALHLLIAAARGEGG